MAPLRTSKASPKGTLVQPTTQKSSQLARDWSKLSPEWQRAIIGIAITVLLIILAILVWRIVVVVRRGGGGGLMSGRGFMSGRALYSLDQPPTVTGV